MHKKSLLAVAVCIGGLSAAPAFAGEVQGPPGAANQPGTYTPVHFGVAASECSFNGLNDFQQGQTDRITQNYGTNIQLGLDLGFPGTDCNPARAD
jgi:opacity protein-like surface antigen